MLCDRQICPRGRYKGTGTIGQYKRQMKFAASMTPAKHIKRRSFKGMARPNGGYLIGKAVEMMSAVVGSLTPSVFLERVEEVRSSCRYLNSYAFCPSAIDVNGLKLAALYTLQDGLPRDA